MPSRVDVAVVGASSLVGEALLEVLEERDFPVAELYLLDAADSVGQAHAFKGRNLRVRDTAGFDFTKARLVFFACDADLAASHWEVAAAAGCLMVDLSSACSVDDLPCLVPEVNGGLLDTLHDCRAVASPLPEAVALSTLLAPVRQQLDVQRVSVTACLPVSTRGRAGVNELARQTAELLNARPLEPRVFDRQVAFNMLAQTEEVDAQGHARQERRLVDELRQLLGLPELAVAVTFVQVPVFFGESLVLSLLSRESVDVDRLSAALDAAPGIELVEAGDYPTVVGDAVGQDVIYVGRLRRGMNDPRELNLWIVSDNVRKGAALNAVQSGELLIKHYL